jgi:hypothetical protein
MQLKNLNLPGSVIADLYKQSLVIADEKISSIETSEKVDDSITFSPAPVTKGIQFLGDNRKNILVLVSNENISYLADEDLSFLTSMLSACKLNLSDVAIVNLDNKPGLSYKEIKNELHSNVVLLFGTTPESINIPVSFPHFQVQSFNNNTFLYIPSLHEIQNDKILKSKLWVCLRRIFNV